ncbi:MAG: hypothetical protein ACRD36_14220, partial [Candidatus Acidiferrum sp.]
DGDQSAAAPRANESPIARNLDEDHVIRQFEHIEIEVSRSRAGGIAARDAVSNASDISSPARGLLRREIVKPAEAV